MAGEMQATAIAGNDVTLLNVSVTAGLPDAPSDANTYGRHAGAWTLIPAEAPIDGQQYARSGGAWAVVAGAGIADAPSDGTVYGRENAAWVRVPAGPAGATGAAGKSSFNTTSTAFTIPAVGATTTVMLADTSWAVIGEVVYIAGAGGGNLAAPLQITAINGNTLTLLNPATSPAIAEAPSDGNMYGRANGAWNKVLPISGGTLTGTLILAAAPTTALGAATKGYVDSAAAPPIATATNPGLMNTVSGNATDYIGGDNASHGLIPAVQPTIWNARLRNFNSIGNPTFEVDQRQVGGSMAIATGGINTVDRWSAGLNGTMRYSVQQTAANVPIPGTSFFITSKILRITLTTGETALGASDWLGLWTWVEGPMLRELLGDVHSLSLLVRSSVANQKFGISLVDIAGTRTLGKLCPLAAANSWTMVTLPNLPVWAPGATWSTSPGVAGYQLNVALAAGTGVAAPANDTWQTTANWAPAGIDNFAGAAVNSTFDLAFVQHEPGMICTTLIDKPFNPNYDECLRYYQKIIPYGSVFGGTSPTPYWNFTLVNTTAAVGVGTFRKPMAKTPTITLYNASTGAANSVWNHNAGASFGVNSVGLGGSEGFYSVNLSTASTTGQIIGFAWSADTGW
jgi:hypothetical protein